MSDEPKLRLVANESPAPRVPEPRVPEPRVSELQKLGHDQVRSMLARLGAYVRQGTTALRRPSSRIRRDGTEADDMIALVDRIVPLAGECEFNLASHSVDVHGAEVNGDDLISRARALAREVSLDVRCIAGKKARVSRAKDRREPTWLRITVREPFNDHEADVLIVRCRDGLPRYAIIDRDRTVLPLEPALCPNDQAIAREVLFMLAARRPK